MTEKNPWRKKKRWAREMGIWFHVCCLLLSPTLHTHTQSLELGSVKFGDMPCSTCSQRDPHLHYPFIWMSENGKTWIRNPFKLIVGNHWLFQWPLPHLTFHLHISLTLTWIINQTSYIKHQLLHIHIYVCTWADVLNHTHGPYTCCFIIMIINIIMVIIK